MSRALCNSYVPVWCKSNGSFLEGASHPEELVEQAHQLRLPALALTDRNGVYGLARAHMRAQELGQKLLSGCQLQLEDGSRLVVLAESLEGYQHMCRLITLGCRRSSKGECSVKWAEVAAHAGGMLALWGGQGSLLQEGRGEVVKERGGLLKEAFQDRLYALVAR
ncbi:MAG: PHP domain-containing protein, partial [Candidatus Eremiobacteraeota bacterium]|nr:PHP domain-containing protein [Candidatus Eremiobacteraeota bacterium]